MTIMTIKVILEMIVIITIKEKVKKRIILLADEREWKIIVFDLQLFKTIQKFKVTPGEIY